MERHGRLPGGHAASRRTLSACHHLGGMSARGSGGDEGSGGAFERLRGNASKARFPVRRADADSRRRQEVERCRDQQQAAQRACVAGGRKTRAVGRFGRYPLTGWTGERRGVCASRLGSRRFAGWYAARGAHRRLRAIDVRMRGQVHRVHRMPVRVRVVQANHAGQRLQRQDQHEAPANEVTNCVSHQGLGGSPLV